MLPTKFQVNWPFGTEEELTNSGHLEFPVETMLAIFDLQVTTMLPTKFQVNWPFDSREEAKNRFSRWPSWWSSWISNWKDFNYF